MTNEEAIAIITEAIEDYVCNHVTDTAQAQRMLNAVQALEQEQSGDLISRQAVIKAVDKHTLDRSEIVLDEDITVILEEVPSVAISSAEQKTGHWIERRSRATGHIESVCSECGAEEGYPYNDYCGNCGCRMVELQERSE